MLQSNINTELIKVHTWCMYVLTESHSGEEMVFKIDSHIRDIKFSCCCCFRCRCLLLLIFVVVVVVCYCLLK